MNTDATTLQFKLPEHLACPKPTEQRNLRRDGVRLLVTSGSGDVDHTLFSNIENKLEKGDVLVVNTSATRAAAFRVTLPENRSGVVHISTPLPDGDWLIEVREINETRTVRWKEGKEGMAFSLADTSLIFLKKRFYKDNQLLDLWIAEFQSIRKPEDLMNRFAQPIKYDKLDEIYPLDYYQTFFSLNPGSSEMPSAGRGFTDSLVNKLLTKGVVFAPILLHTGVSSLEENERPYPEYMEISPLSARIINHAKDNGKRIIAVGTTAIRAIESATDGTGEVHPFLGYTSLFIDENYSMKATNGLLTGFHEPRASHLFMLQSLAGIEHVERAYQIALARNYYWHQFGDLHLILP
ncbi:MAG TPA: S-adenosylmethionine:tRNA ribosyltransferase-isomerase [Chryseolinea sp.]|nr:S-adenosylmethionine:tRNA ribosyltransferase-isomerase [Chryseolinea sp.]